MPSWMLTWDPVLLAALSACLTWAVTALGSLTVFLLPRKKVSMEPLLAASAGVMLAASFWSLLAPAIASAPAVCALPAWAVAALGFLCGGAFLALGDLAVRLLRRRLAARRPAAMRAQEQGAADSRRRCELLVWSITLHNIPEGLAIGVAFGSLKGALTPAALAAAFSVALGIGLQNFPEGAAVALPLLREGCSRRRAFFLGQLSGLVEPLAALAGAALVTAAEFAVGCVVNLLLGWNVWDYSGWRVQLLGQICLVFCLLWYLLCLGVLWVFRAWERRRAG